jgi:hypothetical protein
VRWTLNAGRALKVLVNPVLLRGRRRWTRDTPVEALAHVAELVIVRVAEALHDATQAEASY